MPLTFDRKAFKDVTSLFQHREELVPKPSAPFGFEECVRISDQNQPVPCTREKDVESLGRTHEPNVVFGVRPRQARDNDVALFSLIVICNAGYVLRTIYFVETLPIVANRIPGWCALVATEPA